MSIVEHNVSKLQTIVYHSCPIYIKDGDTIYHIFNVLLKIDKNFKDINYIIEILNQCRKRFRKDCYLQGTLAAFYNDLGFKMYNHIYVLPPFEELITLKNYPEFMIHAQVFEEDCDDLQFGARAALYFAVCE